ncbi:MAG: hypothetical protein ACRETD_10790, partial [Steroidobacteraceae bacterium]
MNRRKFFAGFCAVIVLIGVMAAGPVCAQVPDSGPPYSAAERKLIRQHRHEWANLTSDQRQRVLENY